MNIFLNELYRLEDSQEGSRALVESANQTGKIAEVDLAKFSNTH